MKGTFSKGFEVNQLSYLCSSSCSVKYLLISNWIEKDKNIYFPAFLNKYGTGDNLLSALNNHYLFVCPDLVG